MSCLSLESFLMQLTLSVCFLKGNLVHNRSPSLAGRNMSEHFSVTVINKIINDQLIVYVQQQTWSNTRVVHFKNTRAQYVASSKFKMILSQIICWLNFYSFDPGTPKEIEKKQFWAISQLKLRLRKKAKHKHAVIRKTHHVLDQVSSVDWIARFQWSTIRFY